MENTRLRIVYIAGSGHSGSTLTDLILGTHPRIESVGEFYRLAESFSEAIGRKCGCGQILSKCPMWSSVFEAAKQEIDLATFCRDVNLYSIHNEVIIRNIMKQTGAHWIVDSSKRVNRLRQLVSTDLFDVRVIHLIRDGRAVAFSNARKGRKPLERASKWAVKNMEFLSLRDDERLHDAWITLRYENLVTDPNGETQRLMDFIGEEFVERQLDYFSCIHHNVGGNRMRHSSQSVIKMDKEYIDALDDDAWERLTDACGDMLSRFGYPADRREMEQLLGRAEGLKREIRAAVS